MDAHGPRTITLLNAGKSYAASVKRIMQIRVTLKRNQIYFTFRK